GDGVAAIIRIGAGVTVVLDDDVTVAEGPYAGRSVVGTGIDGAVVGHRHPKIPIGADADRIAVKGDCPHAAAVAHLDLLAVGSNGIGVSVVAAGRVHATPVVHL